MKQANQWSDSEKQQVVAFLTEIFQEHAFITPEQIGELFYQSIYLEGETYLASFEQGQVTAIAAMIVEAIERDGIVYFSTCYCKSGKEEALKKLMLALENQGRHWGAKVSKVGLRKENSHLAEMFLPQLEYSPVYRIVQMGKEVQVSAPLPDGFSSKLASSESLADFVDLHNLAFRNSPNGSQMLMGEAEENLERQNKGEAKLGFLQYHQEPVGTYLLSKEKGLLWVDAVTINPEHQGKGWGKILIQAAEQEALAMASQVHLLVVDANQAAFRLYQRTGFLEEKVYSEWFEKSL